MTKEELIKNLEGFKRLCGIRYETVYENVIKLILNLNDTVYNKEKNETS